MIKQDTQNLINSVTKELMNISSLLEESDVDKSTLIHRVNHTKDLFLKNTEDVRLNETPQYLALQTALKDIDNIFDELVNEIQKA
jgi:hypothetical protein